MWVPPPTSGRSHRDATSDQEDVLTGRGDAVDSLAQFPPDAAHLTVRLAHFVNFFYVRAVQLAQSIGTGITFFLNFSWLGSV